MRASLFLCLAISLSLPIPIALPGSADMPSYAIDPSTVTFIEPQKPPMLDPRCLVATVEQKPGYVDFRSVDPKDFQNFQGYYICLGAFTTKVLDMGNFHIVSRMGIIREDPDQKPFRIDAKLGTHWYEFEIGSGQIKLVGILLDAARYMPTPSSGSAAIPLDGSALSLEFVRQASRVVILVNQEVLHEIPNLELTAGNIGFTVERPKILRVKTHIDPPTTLRFYELKATGCIRDMTDKELAQGIHYMKRTGNAYAYVHENPECSQSL